MEQKNKKPKITKPFSKLFLISSLGLLYYASSYSPQDGKVQKLTDLQEIDELSFTLLRNDDYPYLDNVPRGILISLNDRICFIDPTIMISELGNINTIKLDSNDDSVIVYVIPASPNVIVDPISFNLNKMILNPEDSVVSVYLEPNEPGVPSISSFDHPQEILVDSEDNSFIIYVSPEDNYTASDLTCPVCGDITCHESHV